VKLAALKDAGLARIYHHCFRDKMSWREFGMGQCGVVKYNGAPRPLTYTFAQIAQRLNPLPLSISMPRLKVAGSVGEVDMRVEIRNNKDKPCKGVLKVEAPRGVKVVPEGISIQLEGFERKELVFTLKLEELPVGLSHIFLRCELPGYKPIYGWGTLARSAQLQLDRGWENIPGVEYVPLLEAVEEFLQSYGEECAISVGPCIGSDMEMGYRLKSVLEALLCKEVLLRPALFCKDILDRPLIIIGNPRTNFWQRLWRKDCLNHIG